MVDGVHPTQGLVTITQSRTSWGIEVGRHRLAVTRMREARTVGKVDLPRGRSAMVRSIWPITIGTFASVSALGLVVFGAVASEPLSFGRQRYSLSVPLPAWTAKPATNRLRHGPKVRMTKVIAPATTLAHDADVLHSPALADEVYIARAVRTGEFQEWLGADDQRRFLSAGPEQADGYRRCRALALLIRRTDGGNEVHNSRRCTDAPASGSAVADLEKGDAPSRAAPDSALVLPEEDATEQSTATAGR